MSNKTKMWELAKEFQLKSYSPYSKFKVGACILSENGNFYGGCNIENAAYPQGWCAECSAISSMIMNGDKIIKEICIVGDGNELCTPCGGCRQKIREFIDIDCFIHIASKEAMLQTFTLSALLPYSFGPNNLE